MYEKIQTPRPMKTKMIVISFTVLSYSSLDVAGPKESKTLPMRKEKTGRDAPVKAAKTWPKTIMSFSWGVASDISFP
jgi:hypothetical protein